MNFINFLYGFARNATVGQPPPQKKIQANKKCNKQKLSSLKHKPTHSHTQDHMATTDWEIEPLHEEDQIEEIESDDDEAEGGEGRVSNMMLKHSDERNSLGDQEHNITCEYINMPFFFHVCVMKGGAGEGADALAEHCVCGQN